MTGIKSHLFLLSILMTGIVQAALSNALKLNDASVSKTIHYTLHGNSASTHYLEPVILEISNISPEPVTVSLENGDMFIPDDAAKQNIVVTSPELVQLKPFEKKAVKLKGMCTEQNDGSGDDATVYTYKPSGNDSLKRLADFIASKKYQSSAAQYAVWSLMSNGNLNSIYSADSTEENDLRKFMASLTGKTYSVQTRDYRYNYYTPPAEKVGGHFGFSFSRPQDVQIAMFDKNGILVRELYNQKKVAAGDHTFNFEFDSAVYTDDVYYFKLIMGGEVMMDQELNVQSIRDSFRHKIENRN